MNRPNKIIMNNTTNCDNMIIPHTAMTHSDSDDVICNDDVTRLCHREPVAIW